MNFIVRNDNHIYQLVNWASASKSAVKKAGFLFDREEAKIDPESVVEKLMRIGQWKAAEFVMDNYM